MLLPLNLGLLGSEKCQQVLLQTEPLSDTECLLGLLYRIIAQLRTVDELSNPHSEGGCDHLHVRGLPFGLQLVSVNRPLQKGGLV